MPVLLIAQVPLAAHRTTLPALPSQTPTWLAERNVLLSRPASNCCEVLPEQVGLERPLG